MWRSLANALDIDRGKTRWFDKEAIRPYVGIAGVLLGSILATLGSRVTTFGLADLRGQLHAGFDEGAWITTSFGVGQMLAGVASPYLGAIFGARRLLLLGVISLFTASLLGPFSVNLPGFLVTQLFAGIGSGTFIPVAIGFIVRSLPARLLLYGLAAYAMNSEFSQNVGASLEGWYADQWTWHWIDWQYCFLLVPMFACVWFGVPKEPVNFHLFHEIDWPGLVYAATGFGLLYAGLDQGNRLDWTNNGLITGLLVSGGILTVAFFAREFLAKEPFLNLHVLLRGRILILILLLAGFRFIILSTAYIIPTYLQTVQSFRELQVGSVLLWIALPQFAILWPLATLLKHLNARWVLAAGTALIAIACFMATQLTTQWATDDFLPSQILQAIGQSLALTALVVLIVQAINPRDVLTIGALLQISRLFGGELGTAFMQTFVRVREQIHSNLLGLHVDAFSTLTGDRLLGYGAVVGARTSDLANTSSKAASLLAGSVAQQAQVLSYIDGFQAAGFGAIVCLLLAVSLGPGTAPEPKPVGFTGEEVPPA